MIFFILKRIKKFFFSIIQSILQPVHRHQTLPHNHHQPATNFLKLLLITSTPSITQNSPPLSLHRLSLQPRFQLATTAISPLFLLTTQIFIKSYICPHRQSAPPQQ